MNADESGDANDAAAAIDRRRREVELARLALDEEEVQLKRAKLQHEREQLGQQSASILRLNVGGQHFDTTRETLLGVGSSFFRRLLDEPAQQTAAGDVAIRGAMRDADGRLFIDRSPDGFRLVLQWCRGNGDVGVYDDATRSLLLDEAMYYDLPRLVAQLQVRGYDPSRLSTADQEIRIQAATLRTALAEGREGAAAEADAALIPVFDPKATQPGLSALDRDRDVPELHGAALLFSAEAQRTTKYIQCKSDASFRLRLDAFAGPLFAGLDLTNIVVAGGAIMHVLMLGDSTTEASDEARLGSADVDLFIVADDDTTARAAFFRVYAHLKGRLAAGNHPNQSSLLMLRSRFAVTFYTGYPQRTIQVVLRRHACVADVIFNFDVDACQLAYDGQRVWATPSAQRAFRTGINFADPERSSPAYEQRLAKYSTRGFAVAVPGLELKRVAKPYISGIFTWVDSLHMRRLLLTFGGADKPNYSVSTQDIVGLPRLLVLSALRSHAREGAQRRTVFGDRQLQLPPQITAPEGAGTYVVSLEKLNKYGVGPGSRKDVWREPPPARPPAKILWGGYNNTRRSLLNDDNDYSGVLLPYHENPLVGPQAHDGLEEYVQHHVVELAIIADSDDEKTLSFCYQVINATTVVGDGPETLGHIMDASTQFEGFYQDGNNPKLPRLLELPASNASGVPNPFARLPADDWFGDVYSSS